MVTAWRWIHEDRRLATTDWSSPLWKLSGQKAPTTKEKAAKFIQDYIDEGLEFFPPGLALRGGLRSPWDPRPATQEEYQPVFPICCLQLANHIFEGTAYRLCQKTDCNRHFFRQEGRAEYGQYRTTGDLQFCSKRCANTQGQRDRRGSKGARRRPRRRSD
jgi:hypothetical protein